MLLAVLGAGIVDPATPVIRADDPGLTRGDGCFEGARLLTRADGTRYAAKLDRHLARMARSAAALEIAFDPAPWQELVAVACAAWTGGDEAAIKLVLTRGTNGQPSGFLTVVALDPDWARQRVEGIRVAVLDRGYPADAFTDTPWLLGGVKTLSYAVNMAAIREAARRGAEDVLFVSSDGHVLEAPTGTAVWASGDTLHTTPRGATGILAGTTQELLFERAAEQGWQTAHTLASVADLHDADAFWLISSVRGPTEVIELAGRPRQRRPDLDGEIKKLSGF
ncbi:MAG TPA: aminotransferase class IV [Jatrophihabitans sp.]|jgi:4-amino-4-deoxychorismate lyase